MDKKICFPLLLTLFEESCVLFIVSAETSLDVFQWPRRDLRTLRSIFLALYYFKVCIIKLFVVMAAPADVFRSDN